MGGAGVTASVSAAVATGLWALGMAMAAPTVEPTTADAPHSVVEESRQIFVQPAR